MSRYDGPMGPSQKNGRNKGVQRALKAQRRAEAEVRDEELAEDAPQRRRNKGTVIVAPAITLQATGDVAG